MEQASVVAGVTGSQNGMELKQFQSVTHLFTLLMVNHIHHGDCVGADAQFHLIARRLRLPITIHPPDNPSKRAYLDSIDIRPELPYMVRNQNIVDEAEVLIAAPKQFDEVVRSGTWSTVRKAAKKGIPVYIVTPEGIIEERSS